MCVFWGLVGWFWEVFCSGSCSAGGSGIVVVIFKKVFVMCELKRKGKGLLVESVGDDKLD
jgi:hypothetical protein